MKSAYLIGMLAVTVLFHNACNTKSRNSESTKVSDSLTVLSPYLGQKPPGLIPEIFAPGFVSTDALEVEGAFAPDMKEFYFIRQEIGEKSKSYVIQFKDGSWTEAIERPSSEGEVFISTDGKTMHLGNTYRERTAMGWSDEKRLAPLFDEYPIMRLTASSSGTYVFDVRDSIGTIRYSRLVEGQHRKPVAFGPQVNSGIYTAHPFIAPDESYIIWDSTRDEGYGASDLYISFRQHDGSWGAAINMGENINTEFEDSYGSVTSDGKYFIFQTINFGESIAESTANIYWVDAQIIEALKPK